MHLKSQSTQKCETRVLLLIDNQYSILGQQIRMILNYLKVQYKSLVVRRNLPSLANQNTGRYLMIIYENYYRYLNMNRWNRQLLDKYCREYGASIVAFFPNANEKESAKTKVPGFPLYLYSGLRLLEANSSDYSRLLYYTKRGISFGSQISKETAWVGFSLNHSTYESILYGWSSFDKMGLLNVSLIVLDRGQLDGVRRLLFGNDFASFWPMKLLFLDGLRYLTNDRISLPLTRYLQVDIDDIFVGHEGSKMTADDVSHLQASQMRMRKYVTNFVYNLGFCGRFFGKGNKLEKQGDQMLLGKLWCLNGEFVVEKAADFWWFPHHWRHAKAHQMNRSSLVSSMEQNYNFAKKNGIKIAFPYAVAPHHSGVYPTHDALYEAWKEVWNIQVTSTEEYPHLKPASLRRGFIYKDIMVLPRQTCGLYTHTIYMNQFPGGKSQLDKSIFGGELFYTFVFNPFLIFMTHQANYARDRLASYTFESVVRFIRCWTTLKLETIPPSALAEQYFQHYPDELNPVWGDPCQDKRHLAILASDKLCQRFPNAIIVGPQKTGSSRHIGGASSIELSTFEGTTALYKFLQLHPAVRGSQLHPRTYEEVQFFCGRNYLNGINSYANYFPVRRRPNEVLIEKSATYFDCDLAPLRVKALLPDVKIVVILISPALRAYSWYQHMKAHEDRAAMANDFIDVLQAKEESGPEIWRFHQRCLVPGHYSHHLERWLSHFPAKQINIIDGEQLKHEPFGVMSAVQDYLELHPMINYNELLTFNAKKGFYCLKTLSNHTYCLGESKGRHYEPMSEEARRWLLNYYKSHNAALLQLLSRLGYEAPSWLQQELREAV
ncbi:bifunctional heparan sulfate [Trichuris trichiura]|uniref:[heparan sulfate]-glucosamine N-sulfotransferase n=1 Tax=Trichuris trichiura TaxID=36087 RepID=A0A077Z048_TRITR|nr:bifunctional heparan sulfate [Trichuris trichiura]